MYKNIILLHSTQYIVKNFKIPQDIFTHRQLSDADSVTAVRGGVKGDGKYLGWAGESLVKF